jgi:hypothetical protein
MTDRAFKGNVVLLTGASMGIGEQIADQQLLLILWRTNHCTSDCLKGEISIEFNRKIIY